MTHGNKPNKKTDRKNTRNRLPVFEPDQDFSLIFRETDLPLEKEPGQAGFRTNKHGLPVLEDLEGLSLSQEQDPVPDPAPKTLDRDGEPPEPPENFAALLESFLKQPSVFPKKKRVPMPLKQRIKRYPSPEAELDLHGFTALGAENKTRSFILNCKHQGYFTLRLIVGKGLHSDLGPVLPDVVADLLQALKKENIVLAYEWDQRSKFKSGALIVYLKQFQD